jgi:hypothetical protein
MPAKLPPAIPPFRLPEEFPRAVTPFSDWPALGFPPVIALVPGTPGSPPCPPRRNAATTALAQARFNMTSLLKWGVLDSLISKFLRKNGYSQKNPWK